MFDKILFLSVKLFGSVKKWSSIENGDRTFPRIYCARNDAAKGPRNASLCECSLDSRTLCSYYHAGLYSAQWSPSRTESFSTRVLSYDIPRPYHIRIPVILLHFIRSNNVFSKKKKIFLGIQSTRNRYSKYTFNPYIAYTRFFRSINYYSCHLNYDHFINYHRFQTDHWQRDLKYLWASKTRSNTRDRKIVQHWIIRNENFNDEGLKERLLHRLKLTRLGNNASKLIRSSEFGSRSCWKFAFSFRLPVTWLWFIFIPRLLPYPFFFFYSQRSFHLSF